MALVSADSRVAELLGEWAKLIKQTQVTGLWLGVGQRLTPPPPPQYPLLTAFLLRSRQVGRSYSEHNSVNMQKKHEWVQTENKSEEMRGALVVWDTPRPP